MPQASNVPNAVVTYSTIRSVTKAEKTVWISVKSLINGKVPRQPNGSARSPCRTDPPQPGIGVVMSSGLLATVLVA